MCAEQTPLVRVRDVEPRGDRTDLRCAGAHGTSGERCPG